MPIIIAFESREGHLKQKQIWQTEIVNCEEWNEDASIFMLLFFRPMPLKYQDRPWNRLNKFLMKKPIYKNDRLTINIIFF